MELKTAAAYIRVSTDSQTELSPDSQIKEIRKFAKQHGYIVPREYIFRDDGISGRKAEKRPEFIRMIGIAKEKPSPFSAVLLWKFSRFARNQEEAIFYKSMLAKNQIEVKSISEPIIDGPFGSLIERIIEWFDEFYSINLSGEVRRGMTEKVERGGAVSIPAFGYDIVDKQYVINPETAPIVRMIYSEYLNGTPVMQIAHKLNAMHITTTRGNLWENRTVQYILQNPVYIGKIRWNPKRRTRRDYDDPDIMIVDGTHEPIIDSKTFDQVQEMIKENQKAFKRYNRSIKDEYMLHGLLKCSACGASLSRNGENGVQCIKYTHGKCNTSHYINLATLNQTVLDTIEDAFETGIFDIVVKHVKQADPPVDHEALIKKEQLKLSRIQDAYEDGVYTLEEFKERKAVVKESIDALRTARDRSETDDHVDKKDFIKKNKVLLKQLRNARISEAEKNIIIKSFVDKITFHRDTGFVDIIFYS